MTLTEQIRGAIFGEFIRENYAKFETAKLPTERELAAKYRVSLVTVRRAIDELEQKQFVQRRQGSGTYVIDRRTLEKHYSIALAVPAEADSVFYTVLAGRIEPELRRLGHEAQLLVVEDAEALLKTFRNRGIRPDAVVVCGFLVGHLQLAEAGIPYVIAGGEGYQCADNVAFDLRAGVRNAVSYLIRLGHRRILFLSNLDERCELATRINREFVFEMSSRYQGYCDALLAAGIPIDRARVLPVGVTKRNSYQMMKRLLASGTFDSTAIFASTDMLAEGAATALAEAGIAIPEQVSLIGCDNIADERELLLPLTSLDLRLDDVAGAALRLLLERIDHPAEQEYRSVVLIPRLVRPEGTVRRA